MERNMNSCLAVCGGGRYARWRGGRHRHAQRGCSAVGAPVWWGMAAYPVHERNLTRFICLHHLTISAGMCAGAACKWHLSSGSTYTGTWFRTTTTYMYMLRWTFTKYAPRKLSCHHAPWFMNRTLCGTCLCRQGRRWCTACPVARATTVQPHMDM